MCLVEFLAADLSGHQRVETFDSLSGVSVGNRLDLERMQLAERCDLLEGQCRIVDQPDGGRFRHQGRRRHQNTPCAFFAALPAKLLFVYLTGDSRNIGGNSRWRNCSGQQFIDAGSEWTVLFADLTR